MDWCKRIDNELFYDLQVTCSWVGPDNIGKKRLRSNMFSKSTHDFLFGAENSDLSPNCHDGLDIVVRLLWRNSRDFNAANWRPKPHVRHFQATESPHHSAPSIAAADPDNHRNLLF